MAALLLKFGADVNARTRMGNVPLLEPAMYNSVASCKLLLEAGGDPYLADNDGVRPVDVARMYPALTALFHQKGVANRKCGQGDTVKPDLLGSSNEVTPEQVESLKEYLRGKGHDPAKFRNVDEMCEAMIREQRANARARELHEQAYAAQAGAGGIDEEDKVHCSVCQKVLATKSEQKRCAQCKVAVYCGPGKIRLACKPAAKFRSHVIRGYDRWVSLERHDWGPSRSASALQTSEVQCIMPCPRSFFLWLHLADPRVAGYFSVASWSVRRAPL